MTNEEAIGYLENIIIFSYQDGYTEPAREALKMALEALKAEPCEDTINRKHLLSEIDDLMKSPWFNRYKDDGGALHFGYTERKEAVEIVRDLCVKALPRVTPKPRTGKWIETTVVIDEFTNEEDTFYVCGCCNERICLPHKYCPNCGAKMEGESEDKE